MEEAVRKTKSWAEGGKADFKEIPEEDMDIRHPFQIKCFWSGCDNLFFTYDRRRVYCNKHKDIDSRPYTHNISRWTQNYDKLGIKMSIKEKREVKQILKWTNF